MFIIKLKIILIRIQLYIMKSFYFHIIIFDILFSRNNYTNAYYPFMLDSLYSCSILHIHAWFFVKMHSSHTHWLREIALKANQCIISTAINMKIKAFYNNNNNINNNNNKNNNNHNNEFIKSLKSIKYFWR